MGPLRRETPPRKSNTTTTHYRQFAGPTRPRTILTPLANDNSQATNLTNLKPSYLIALLFPILSDFLIVPSTKDMPHSTFGGSLGEKLQPRRG